MVCFDNTIVRKEGFYLPCFDCKSIEKCIIIIDWIKNDNFRRDSPHISCRKCCGRLTNVDYDGYEDYSIIYKKLCKKIEKKYIRMLYRLHEISSNNEIGNLSIGKKKIVFIILKLLLYNYITLYGDKKRMINTDYLFKKLFDLLGINLELEIPISYKYEQYFDNMMEYNIGLATELIDDFWRTE